MIDNKLFKTNSISYSRFLQPKDHTIHYLSETCDPMDIEIFKRSTSLHYQNIYTTKKWQSWIYRSIFFGFSLLFFFLAVLIFLKTVNVNCGLYFENCVGVKNFVNSLCLFLAGGAFFIGYKIRPEREAVQYLVGKVDKELSKNSALF